MKKTGENTGYRRSYRLQGYNYSQIGQYYITVCTYQSKNILGQIIDNQKMNLNEMGYIVLLAWNSIQKYFPYAKTDAFVIMPNHIHGVIDIHDSISPGGINAGTAKSLGSIVRYFKSNVTIWARKNTKVREVWQRNYYEHIIRNDVDYERICEYIANNPKNWRKDRLYRDD